MPRSETNFKKLMTGDYPALQVAFLSEVARLRQEDRLVPIIVLVTSHLLGSHLGRYVADKGLPHMNVHFLTLEDLAERVAAPVLYEKGRREAPRFAPEQLIRIIVEDLASASDRFYFSSIAARSGFHKALLGTIGDLKNACMSPADLDRALEDPATAKMVNQEKLRDLKKIWEAYEAGLGRHHWYDEHDMMRVACEALPGSKLFQQASSLLAYGFYDFNALEKCLLKAGFEAKPTAAFVPYESTPAFRYVEPAIKWLRSEGFVKAQAGLAAAGTRPNPVEHLCKHLFKEKSGPGKADDAIAILSAPGELREVREVVRRILSESMDSMISLHEFGILLRNPEVYADLFRQTLTDLGLEPYVPGGATLADTRAGRSVLLMMEILHHDFARRAVMEFVTFARLSFLRDARPGDRLQAAWWDLISIEASIVGGAAEWKDRLMRLLDDIKHREGKEGSDARGAPTAKIAAIQSLRKFMKRLTGSLHAIRDARTWTEKTLNLLDAFSTLVETDEQTEEVRIALEHLSDLDELGTLPTQATFHKLVQEALKTLADPTAKFERTGPAVLDLMAGRGIPFKVVAIPGMVEKSFPPVVRQDPILLDHERTALNRSLDGSDLDPLHLRAARRLDEERLLFRLAVGSARKLIVLSYPRLEIETARERLPSSLLLATVQAFSRERADFSSIHDARGFKRIPLAQIAPRDPAEALEDVEYDLALAAREIRTGQPRYLLHLQTRADFFRWAIGLEAERWGKNVFTCYDGYMCSPEARREVRAIYSIVGRPISPTRLETYATCPFQYFLASVLGIKALVEPERVQRISPLDKGELIHMILWEFLTRLREERGFPVSIRPDDLDILKEIARTRFEEFEKGGVTGYPAMWAVDREAILSCLEDFLEEETGEAEFRPAYFEVRYGMQRKDPFESEISTESEIPLRFGGKEIHLKGRIDRIDVSPDFRRARVIDYKTGRAYAHANDFGGGTSLQLPLYLTASKEILKQHHSEITVEEAQYYHLPVSGKRRHIRFDYDTLDARKDELAGILDTITTSIEAGLFIAVPGDQCKTCDFLTICGSSRHSLFNLKCEDVNTAAFLSLGQEQDR